jgi:hypothetical protein
MNGQRVCVELGATDARFFQRTEYESTGTNSK